MTISLTLLVVVVLSLIVGAISGYYTRQTIARGQVNTAESKAVGIMVEAEKKAKEEIVKAKNKAIEILDKVEEKVKNQEEQINHLQRRLEKREESLEHRSEEIEQNGERLREKAQEIKKIREQIDEMRRAEDQKMEEISGMTLEEAKDEIFSRAQEESKERLAQQVVKLEKENVEELEQKANNIMIQVIQRYARSHASEFMTSTVSIPSEDVKGKIIGKEGRNIRVIEKLTGVEVIIDDSPDTVVVSSFDPIRRAIAKIALEHLMEDGRINPSKIEEAVSFAEKEINRNIKEAGESAVYELGIAGIHPKLIHILGTLRYRTSFKQNVLLHSLEVAFIAGALAAELGYDVNVAKKAGLFHDIGKALDHKVEGTHVNIGIKILEKFNMGKEVIHAMRSHHEEYPYATPEAFIVTAADAISASRPGARRDTVENYIKRLEELEGLVNSFEGVEKTYAIQAGREVRVFVNPEKIDDPKMALLAKDIADRIQSELQYPGEIRVNVMRETRAVEIAR
ncbi:MAG: ribonuclease Y [Candidatus Moraniibacteriota bacterium]|nr:MAG: ribonuclease Y [Candidatus Moranbacteria bacterium]